MFDQKKTLDMCSPRKKANLGARNLILKGVVKNSHTMSKIFKNLPTMSKI